jgi:hypothetical protein
MMKRLDEPKIWCFACWMNLTGLKVSMIPSGGEMMVWHFERWKTEIVIGLRAWTRVLMVAEEIEGYQL